MAVGVAAALAVLASVLGVLIAGRAGRQAVVGQPSTAPSSIGTPSASTASPSERRVAVDQRVAFDHFTVRVSSVEDPAGSGVLVEASVCVRSLPPNPTGDRTRISWDPWTVQAGGRTYRPQLFDTTRSVGSMFPREALYAVGECARGWIPFVLDRGGQVSTVRYENGVGDSARWVVR